MSEWSRQFAPLVAVLLAWGTWADAGRGQELLPRPDSVVEEIAFTPSGESPNGESPFVASTIWGSADYLLWWTRNPRLPVLVTNGDANDKRPGALGQPGTMLKYGGGNVDFKEKSGGRFALGIDNPLGSTLGFDVGYFFLNARTTGFTQASAGNPVIARPFFDALNNQNDSGVISFPGQAQGVIQIANDSFFQGGEANASTVVWSEGKSRVSVLVGFRYLELTEALHVSETDIGIGPLQGSGAQVTDAFDTQNRFYGAQVGLRASTRWKRWTLDAMGKLGIGAANEVLQVDGQTVLANGQVIDAGFLSLSSNRGRFDRTVFAVVPEARINVGFRVTDNWRINAGYSFLYWSRVVRPGDQVDPGLNPNLIPTSQTFGNPGGPARPAQLFRDTDFWAQGLNLGLEFHY